MCAGPGETVSFYLSLFLSAGLPSPACRAASRPLRPTAQPRPMLRWLRPAPMLLKGKFLKCLFLHELIPQVSWKEGERALGSGTKTRSRSWEPHLCQPLCHLLSSAVQRTSPNPSLSPKLRCSAGHVWLDLVNLNATSGCYVGRGGKAFGNLFFQQEVLKHASLAASLLRQEKAQIGVARRARLGTPLS